MDTLGWWVPKRILPRTTKPNLFMLWNRSADESAVVFATSFVTLAFSLKVSKMLICLVDLSSQRTKPIIRAVDETAPPKCDHDGS